MYKNEDYLLTNEVEYLVSCYKKLKYHYYYNKGNVFIREKIAIFEDDRKSFIETFCKLNEFLKQPHDKKNVQYIESLLERIDFYILPKSFEESIKSNFTSNINHKSISKVNYFINLPIELHILDTYWTILIARQDEKDKKINKSKIFGNIIDRNLFKSKTYDFSFNRFLFDNYYSKYTRWKNETYEKITNNYKSKKSTLFIKFDIKDYYYKIRFNLDLIKYRNKDESNQSLDLLTELFRNIIFTYFEKIRDYRTDLENLSPSSLPLPLGLFSSMHLSNIYLNEIDNSLSKDRKIHFGRYVDDFLVSIQKEISNDEYDKITAINELFKMGIIESTSSLKIKNYDFLEINEEKIEMLYFSKDGSRKLIEDYFETYKSMPSDIAFSTFEDLNIEDSTQTVDNFEIERNIELLRIENINKYKVIRFFNLLKSQVRKSNEDENNIDYENDIKKIDDYFRDTQVIENYSNWQNYLYFLVLCNDYDKIYSFFNNTTRTIDNINILKLKNNANNAEVRNKIKNSLYKYLETTLNFALSIDIKFAHVKLNIIADSKKLNAIYSSNMFDNHLIEVPLFNFLDHKYYHSYKDIQVNDLYNVNSNLFNNFKIEFSPRFVYSNELQLLSYLLKILNIDKDQIDVSKVYESFNHLKNSKLFSPKNKNVYFLNKDQTMFSSNYKLFKVPLHGHQNKNLKSLKVAIVNVDLDLDNINDLVGSWSYSTNKLKFDIFQKILHEAIYYDNSKADILVFPELYLPLNWIDNLVTFSKKNNIAIITGTKYVKSDDYYHNLILSLYPIKESAKTPYFVYLDLREKNDYSYIEKYGEFFKKNNIRFKDTCDADYRIFEWNNIKISSLLCFELTDIISRSLHKKNVDIMTISEANRDTNYFSSIVDSTARDLHSIIIQSNISCYGDSKITGPYKTEVKDKVIIKGGINANVIIAEINLEALKDYQKQFESQNIEFINKTSQNDNDYKYIKKPSARHVVVNCQTEES